MFSDFYWILDLHNKSCVALLAYGYPNLFVAVFSLFERKRNIEYDEHVV